MSGLEAKHLVRLPDPFASGLEASAAQANQRRYQDARDRLERFLPGLITRVDRSDTTAEVTLLDEVSPFEVDALWHVLDTVLIHDDARSGRLILGLKPDADETDGELQFATTYEIHRPSLGALASKLAAQASVTVRSVERHHDSLARLAADLTTVLGQRCHVDLIAFGPGADHVDEPDRGGDLLLVPLHAPLSIGSDAHLEGGDEGLPTSPSRRLTANPGQAALVRMGHRAWATSAGLALVLRVVLPVIDASAMRLAAAAAGRYHPMLRADLPTDLDAPIHSYAGSLYDRPGAFHAEASAALSSESQNGAAAWLRASIPASPRHGLQSAHRAINGPMPTLRAPLPGGIMISQVGDDLALAAGGLVVTLQSELAALLAPHLDGRPFEPADIMHELSDSLAKTATGSTDGSVPWDVSTGPEPSGGPPPPTDPILDAFHFLLAIELLEAAS